MPTNRTEFSLGGQSGMPKFLVNYVRYVEAMNHRLGIVMKYGVLVLIGILIIEGISRYILNSPTIWSIELGEFVLGAYFSLAGGYVLLIDEHVRMDTFSSRWSERRRAIVQLVTFSLFAIYICTWLLGGVYNVRFAIEMNQHYASSWGPSLAPIKIILEAGALLLFLQGVAIVIKDISILRGKVLK